MATKPPPSSTPQPSPSSASVVTFSLSPTEGTVNSPVTISATSSGLTDPLYHFWAMTPSGTWELICAFQRANTCVFVPTSAGVWGVSVSAKAAASTTTTFDVAAEDQVLTVMPVAAGPTGSTGGSHVPVDCNAGIPAFPGAEGFGACATGGRGGDVCYVTTLSASAAVSGSLQWCLNQPGSRFVLFKVSGVINGSIEMNRGDVTIAGQTSPGGITVRGFYIQGDQVCEADGCPLPSVYPRNFIIRHIRSRSPLDADGFRLHRAQLGVLDHVSTANADDEAIQISIASDITIQNTLLAETLGEHSNYGGMLLNYSDPTRGFELTRLSIHHNTWNRLVGRMPEVSRENPSAAFTTMDLEVSNNLLWDPGAPVYTATTLGQSGDDPVYFRFNWIGNYAFARPLGSAAPEPGNPAYTYGMISSEATSSPLSRLFFSGNRMNLHPTLSDYALAYCCNDFASATPPANPPANAIAARHPFPTINYTDVAQLRAHMVQNVGAFPRDPMDRRLMAPVANGSITMTRRDQNPANDALSVDFAVMPAAPADTDADGIPDAWETNNGLNPAVAADARETSLSVVKTGIAGYSNLEVYLNELSDTLVAM
jgi:hypothetical protein